MLSFMLVIVAVCIVLLLIGCCYHFAFWDVSGQ
uniref:Uncharacterized protein n=1 Tax=Anguilla anguilla TaxID=7936 RepID=A0A0E9W1B4_ANGAN